MIQANDFTGFKIGKKCHKNNILLLINTGQIIIIQKNGVKNKGKIIKGNFFKNGNKLIVIK